MLRPVCPECPCPTIEEIAKIKVYTLVDTCDEAGSPETYGEEWRDPDSYEVGGFVCSDCGAEFAKPLVVSEKEFQQRHEDWGNHQDEVAAGARTIEVMSGDKFVEELLGAGLGAAVQVDQFPAGETLEDILGDAGKAVNPCRHDVDPYADGGWGDDL